MHRNEKRRAPRLRCLAAAMTLVLGGGALVAPPAVAQAVGEAQRAFDIRAGDLAAALNQFADQSGLQVLFDAALVRGLSAGAVRGNLDARETLGRLLEGTGLEATPVNERTLILKKAGAPSAETSRTRTRSQAQQSRDEDIVGMPAILVEGARTLNVDITRTRDDPQPYVVFDRDLIERSGATNLEQLLQQRLPMNTSVASMGGR